MNDSPDRASPGSASPDPRPSGTPGQHTGEPTGDDTERAAPEAPRPARDDRPPNWAADQPPAAPRGWNWGDQDDSRGRRSGRGQIPRQHPGGPPRTDSGSRPRPGLAPQRPAHRLGTPAAGREARRRPAPPPGHRRDPGRLRQRHARPLAHRTGDRPRRRRPHRARLGPHHAPLARRLHRVRGADQERRTQPRGTEQRPHRHAQHSERDLGRRHARHRDRHPMLTVVVSRAVLGRQVTPGEAWRDARPQLPRLLGLLLLLPPPWSASSSSAACSPGSSSRSRAPSDRRSSCCSSGCSAESPPRPGSGSGSASHRPR